MSDKIRYRTKLHLPQRPRGGERLSKQPRTPPVLFWKVARQIAGVVAGWHECSS